METVLVLLVQFRCLFVLSLALLTALPILDEFWRFVLNQGIGPFILSCRIYARNVFSLPF